MVEGLQKLDFQISRIYRVTCMGWSKEFWVLYIAYSYSVPYGPSLTSIKNTIKNANKKHKHLAPSLHFEMCPVWSTEIANLKIRSFLLKCDLAAP